MRIKRIYRTFIRFCCFSTLLMIGFWSLLHRDVENIKQRADLVIYPDEVVDMALYPDGRVSHNKTEFVQNVAVNRCSWDAILHNTADILTINKTCKLDVKTAITICRAKSEPCKNQITDVACRLYNNNLIPKKLPRFCQREAMHNKGEYLGCYERKKHFKLFIPLSEDETSQETCVEKCFMGGDMYAAPDLRALRCWCGNTLDMKYRLSEKSCGTTCLDSQPKNCTTRYNIKVFRTGMTGQKLMKTQLVTSEDEVRGKTPVRIVFVFTVTGRAVRQIRRLLKAIYHVDHYYYIHVDSRADYLYRELLKLEDIFLNVRLARERFATIWGGASRLQAHLSIMKTLLTVFNWRWDYYINLSETHYPIKTVTSMAMYLQKYQGHNFIQSITTYGPTADKDKVFVECDEHMFLLGKQELPKGISFHSGLDWICLHRDFVEYAVTGTDPLVTGLKEMYKYIISPVESFFLVLVHNSKFCKTWINEDMHFIHWFRKKGCSVREEVDVTGCSPLDIQLTDFKESIVNLFNAPKFWARKFEPIIHQDVLNNIDQLLGIRYNENRSIHRYWQNEFHVLDNPSSTTDLIKTFAYSFIRRSMLPVQSCGLTDFKLIETHVLNFADKFNSYLVKVSTTDTVNNLSYTLECRFSRLHRYRSQNYNIILKRLKTLEVGTHYDKKEEVFRNYPGFIGPLSPKLTLQYGWIGGVEGNVTFTWTDPSGRAVSTLEKHINTEVSKGVDELTTNSTSTLQTGIWKILVQTDGKDVAELLFLVLPLSHNNGHLSEKDDAESMLAYIDWLTSQFWNLEGLCSLQAIGSECLKVELCRNTEWSSMSPDPKSDITTDNKIKTTK